MKILKLAFPIILALAAVSCNKGAVVSENGRISFAVSRSDQVADATKSLVSEFTTLPSAGSFTLEITGNDYNWTGLLSEWDATTALPVGNYTVRAVYGVEGEEGFDKPYFAGQTSFAVIGAQTTAVSIPVSLANTIVKVVCSEMFNNYYPEYAFTVATGSGAEIAFPKGETRGAFIEAYKFTISGSLTSQGGNVQSFSKEYTGLDEKTCYTVNFDVDGVSGLSINITFDDTTEAVALEEVELND